MVQTHWLCFTGVLDEVPRDVFVDVKRDMEDMQPRVVRVGEFLL